MTNDVQNQEEPTVQYYWPNKMGRMLLLSLEDVMGRNGVNAVLNLAKLRHRINNYPPNNLDLGWSFEEMGALNQALDDMYGPRGGRGWPYARDVADSITLCGSLARCWALLILPSGCFLWA